jgi:hypothetical protein
MYSNCRWANNFKIRYKNVENRKKCFLKVCLNEIFHDKIGKELDF